MIRTALLALALIPAPALAQRAELPVRLVPLSNGDRRFATTLTIDGKPVEVGIDTGSTGLRVLPRGLGPSVGAKGPRVSYAYGAGTAFEGQAIEVPIAAGHVTGTVKLMRIDRVGCLAAKQDCPASRVDLPDFGIQGDGIPGQGFAAILGIRLQHDTIDNPFEQLGVHRWIIDLPRAPGEAGRIVLNPDDAELAGYARLRIDANGTSAGCLEGPQKICGRAFFDTGAAGLRVIGGDRSPWPNGTPATIVVGDGRERQDFAVTIGRREQASAMLVVPAGGETRLSFGFAPYFHWSVLYDADAHQIGLKTR